MFKVLHIIGSAHFGGIEKLVYDLSKAQHKKHVDVLVFADRPPLHFYWLEWLT